MVKEIVYKTNINTFGRISKDTLLNINDINKVRIRTTKPFKVDSYGLNRKMTDHSYSKITNETVAAGMTVQWAISRIISCHPTHIPYFITYNEFLEILLNSSQNLTLFTL